MNEKKEAKMHEINERFQKMETRLTACVDAKADNVIKATCEKVDQSYAEVMAVQLKETNNPHLRVINQNHVWYGSQHPI